MIPFDPCLPYRLRDLHAETQKEDSMSWRQNQQTSCIYRLVGNNVDYCEDTISVKTAQILRMKNQKNACSINVEHAISIYWCGLWVYDALFTWWWAVVKLTLSPLPACYVACDTIL